MWLHDWWRDHLFARAEEFSEALGDLKLWKCYCPWSAANQKAEVIQIRLRYQKWKLTDAIFSKLQTLLLYDLPEVTNKEEVSKDLQSELPHCDIQFPYAQAGEQKKRW